ncbi:Vps62-related protein [Actinokineospora alba]|uniref:Vps62-related protein n=1 Tax=Actinokineospora alba TaxID=504798 RepID=UPI001414D86D|nr:Vps62-related protein [Actinokineospora alba]
MYDDAGTGAARDVSLWRPDTTAYPGYYSLGDVAMGAHGKRPANVFLVAGDSGVVARPTGYRLVWSDHGSGGTHDVSLWAPVPPSGYTCLGNVASPSYSQPSTDRIRCVRSDYTRAGSPVKIWDDSESGADSDVGIWQSDPSDHRGLPPSTFVARASHTDPGSPSLFRVLDKRMTNAAALSAAPMDGSRATLFAPVVTLHPRERYFPSTTQHFLANTHERDGHLVTNEPLGCDSCTDPAFLDGQNPGRQAVNAYALIVPRTSNGAPTDTVDIIYWMFYPYNNGKRVCIGVETDGTCVGGWSTFGNHVGDWEHITVRFREGLPEKIFYSQHSGGETFTFGDKNVPLANWRIGVYSALGSHGAYPDAGRHVYRTLPNGSDLADDTADGTRWDTRTNLISFPWRPKGSYTGSLSWLDIASRWGNPKSGCAVVEPVSGECVLNDGPAGPMFKSYSQPPLKPLE